MFALAIYIALTELAFCEEVSDHTGTMFYVNVLLYMLSVWIVRKLGFAFIKFVSKSISANFTIIFWTSLQSSKLHLRIRNHPVCKQRL